MNKSYQLQQFLLQHLEEFDHDSSVGGHINIPEFELFAFDYLAFAENRLNNIDQYKENSDELINCVSHLKRAVDCQLDTFFYTINLYKTIYSRNLKFETKLDFLKGIGVFNSRSLGKLNTLRNKMEHHYEVPKIGDLEVYFDLVSAFISVLQGLMFILLNNRQLHYVIEINNDNQGYFSSYYDDEKLEMIIEWELPEDSEKTILKAHIKDINEFTYFFKIHIILSQLDVFATWEQIYDRIKLIEADSRHQTKNQSRTNN